jgi:hypothetical protein
MPASVLRMSPGQTQFFFFFDAANARSPFRRTAF